MCGMSSWQWRNLLWRDIDPAKHPQPPFAQPVETIMMHPIRSKIRHSDAKT